ncbi:uncharacterized protein METZ01_LOCUS311594, partial [marine metagenome]
FKDGVEQEEFTGQLIIPAGATACNEEWYVEVKPNDGELLGEFVTSNTVLICAANTVPQWSEIDDQHIDEDSGVNTLDISSYITDAEQDESQIAFQVIVNSDSDHLDTAFDGYNLLLTPVVENYNTTDAIILTLQADDGFGGIVTQTVSVFIDPVNDAPVMTAIVDTSTAEETPLTITVSSSDVDTGTGDGDENIAVYTAESSSDDNVAVIMDGDQLTMTPSLDFHGDVTITVTVTDDGNLSDDTDFVLTITPVNDAPIIEDIASQVMDEDTTLDITLSASDVDDGTGAGDENDLSFSAISDNADISVDVTGDELTITPEADYYGSGTITVTVTDMGSRLTDETSFSITVTNINDAPVLTDIGPQSTNEE